MFDSTRSKDKLTVITECDGVRNVIRPHCSLSLIDRILNFFGCKPCTGDLVVNAGITDIASYIKDNYTIAAYGSGNTAPIVSQTALDSEIARKAVDVATLTTTTMTSDTAHFEVTFTIASDCVVNEFALIKSDGITMMCRQLAGPLTLRAGNKVTFIEDIQES